MSVLRKTAAFISDLQGVCLYLRPKTQDVVQYSYMVSPYLVSRYQEVGKAIMISQITSTGIRIGMMAVNVAWHKRGKASGI